MGGRRCRSKKGMWRLDCGGFDVILEIRLELIFQIVGRSEGFEQVSDYKVFWLVIVIFIRGEFRSVIVGRVRFVSFRGGVFFRVDIGVGQEYGEEFGVVVGLELRGQIQNLERIGLRI